jgi:hypothetical protein
MEISTFGREGEGENNAEAKRQSQASKRREPRRSGALIS